MGEPRPILGISGIATYFPVDSRSPADEVAAGRLTAEQAQYHPDVRAFFADDQESPIFMAVEAGCAALAKSGRTADDISRLYYGWTNYQGYDYFTPSHAVADRMGLPRTSIPVGIQQACNGAAMGLSMSADRLAAAPDEHALVITSDRFGGPGVDHFRSHRALAHSDGAVAAVVGAPVDSDLLHVLSIEHVAGSQLWKTRDDERGFDRPSQSLPPFLMTMPTEKFGREGGRELLGAVSRECLSSAIEKALGDVGIGSDDPRITDVWLPRLGGKVREMLVGAADCFAPELIRCRYSETGHLGAGDFIANLEMLTTEVERRSGDLAVIIGAGGGYTYSCAVVRFP